MAKISLTSILGGLFSRAALNRNFDKIVDEFNNRVLYRDNPPGTANQMKNELDMNRNRIVNVPTPTSSSEVATKRYVDDVATGSQIPTTNGTFDSIVVDEIDEKTANAGVNIDGAVLKDGDGNFSTVTATTSVVTDTIGERTSDAGVTVGGVLLKDGAFSASTVNADVIAEKTNDTGVTIDGVLLKDEGVFVGKGDYRSGVDIGVSKDSPTLAQLARTTADSEAPFLYLSKARGAIGAQAIVNNEDQNGTIVFQGYDGTNMHNYSAIQGEVVDNTVGSEVGRIHFYVSRAGVNTNVLTLAGGYAQSSLRPTAGVANLDLGSSPYPFKTTYTSKIRVDAGTPSVPSYSFDNDVNTGFYSLNGDLIGIANNGTHSAAWDGSGRLIIGPDETSYQTGEGFEGRLQINGTTGAECTAAINRISNNDKGGFLSMNKARGTAAAPAIVLNGDTLGTLSWSAHNGTDFDNLAAAIVVSVDGTVTPGSSRLPGKIEIFNNETATAAFESDNYFSVTKGITHAVFTNTTRPAANTLKAGTQIWNSDDNAPNYSDGTAWRAADGTVT